MLGTDYFFRPREISTAAPFCGKKVNCPRERNLRRLRGNSISIHQFAELAPVNSASKVWEKVWVKIQYRMLF